MRERAPEVEIVPAERPGGNAFTELAMNGEAKTIAEASNVFSSMGLSTVFDVPIVRALSVGMKVAKKWRFFPTRMLLAQAVLRYPTTERLKGSAQPQLGGFDLTSCFTMNRTLELSQSRPSYGTTNRFVPTSFSSWERASRHMGFSSSSGTSRKSFTNGGLGKWCL
jgi:hypothetical protein